MASKRPITFLFLAVLNFIAAVSFIGCGVCANVMDSKEWFIEVNKVRWDDKKLSEHLKTKVPGYPTVKITGIVVGYAVCVGLILSGVALFFGGLLPKLFALLVYGGGLVHHIAMTVYQLVWVNPATDELFNQIPAAIIVGNAATEATRWWAKIPGYVSIAWWIVGVLFYFLGIGIVGLSFLGKDAQPDDKPPVSKSSKHVDEAEEDDDEDERPRKKRPRG